MLLTQGSDPMNFPGNWEVSGSLREPWRPAGATSQLTVEGSARYLKAVLLGGVTLCPGYWVTLMPALSPLWLLPGGASHSLRMNTMSSQEADPSPGVLMF